METSPITPIGSKLTAEEEEALASQLMEIIGGITGGACQTPEEPEEKYFWSLEEGDDSVFYSDEDQGHQEPRDAALSTFGARVCRLDNSVADDEAAQPMEEDDTAENVSQIVKETIQQKVCTEIQNKLEPLSSLVISAAATGGTEFDGSCGELDTRSTEQKVQVEEDVQEIQASGKDAFHVSDIRIHERLNRTPEVLHPLERSSSRQLERERDGEQDHGFHLHTGFHQSHGQEYFTVPLMRKAAPGINQTTFDHLSSPRYSTTSYRKIRRGNTRQRIEEFEFIMKNQ